MSVNLEIKGMLAKLLATEDIIIEHKRVETACFNVHTRVLTLPLWEKASNSVYDLLCAHEVGHSRETPNFDWTKDHNVPTQYVNLVEDVRVEKLMKRRYAGLAKTFFNGYKELAEQDFFQLNDDDVSSYSLADRANLLFKIGNFIDVKIEPGEETDIVKLIGETETFGEVLIAAEVLYQYCKKKKEEEDANKPDDLKPENQPSSESENSNSDNQTQSQQSDSDDSGQSNQEENNKPNDLEKSSNIDETEPEIKTAESLENSLKNLLDKSGGENVYLEIPKLDLKKIIVSNSEIHDRCREDWNNFLDLADKTRETAFGEFDKSFDEFKRSAQKEVNYLVKEFECRKAADSYARATTARTGVLDCSKLHTYKYNEDLFKKITTLSDGKNHGLIFILDWSGSMSNVMLDTVKQLFNLIWFCKKVSIPFEVYAFTTEYPIASYDENNRRIARDIAYQRKDGLIQVGEWFSMLNLLTSKVSGKILNEQLRNIYHLAISFNRKYYCEFPIPLGLSLSATPLNEALISLHQLLPKFQKENKLQKVQCIILTDGEATPIKYHREVYRSNQEEYYMGTAHIGSYSFLRDRKTGNTYSFDGDFMNMPDIFLRNLKDNFKDTNFIGIRVLESRDCSNFIRRYCDTDEYEKLMNYWKKEKSFSIHNSGYDVYFGLSSSALSQDTEFEVAEDATKSQIKNAFVKSLKTKKLNKKVLGKFMEFVV